MSQPKPAQMPFKWDKRSDRGNIEKRIKPGNLEWRLNCMRKRLIACGKELINPRSNSPQDRMVLSFTTIFTPD